MNRNGSRRDEKGRREGRRTVLRERVGQAGGSPHRIGEEQRRLGGHQSGDGQEGPHQEAQRLQGEVGRSGKTTKSTVPATETAATSECPRGGDHEWTEADGERFCSKCSEPAPAKAKGKKAKRSDSPKEKKLSAIDAAAKVLAEAAEPMNAKQMIDAMAAKGYWTSPGGKTPHATLYTAIIREITAKGNDARFTKTERGKFAANG